MTKIDMKPTIVPKSDQLNADDLISGPITIKITAVNTGAADQPISLRFEGDAGRPYKPCKTMRRVLVAMWGDDGNAYVGRYLTLFNDPTVKWGGVEVGGIRISHASHISEEQRVSTVITKGKKAPWHVKPLQQSQQQAQPAPPAAHQEQNTAADSKQEPGQQQVAQGSQANEGDFLILPASGDPLRFKSPEDLHRYLAANVGKFGTKAILEAFTDRNEANFDQYAQADQTGFMKQVWDILNQKKKEFEDVSL